MQGCAMEPIPQTTERVSRHFRCQTCGLVGDLVHDRPERPPAGLIGFIELTAGYELTAGFELKLNSVPTPPDVICWVCQTIVRLA